MLATFEQFDSMNNAAESTRCDWASTALSIIYHDTEWGVPVHDDARLFEMLTLEGAQAGLSWETILAKRAGYRELFYNFDITRVARMTARQIESRLKDARIVRHRLKVESTVSNARAALVVQEAFGSLDAYLWQFVDGKSVKNKWRKHSELPASTALSDTLSKDLKTRGFRFVGSTICYAFMQAVGMVNDHRVTCFRRDECA